MRQLTEQERFWAGDFGDAYTKRNVVMVEQRIPFFTEIMRLARKCDSVCEIGANVGQNLIALQTIRPSLHVTGLEPNSSAFQQLSSIPGIHAIQSSIQDYQPERRFNLVFTCGVLIHISPNDLLPIYKKLAAMADRYVLINEYFNPTPTEIVYRGHFGKLFKRDFAGEFLDATEGFQPVHWGFLWKRIEPAWDNSTWTLLRRSM